MASVQVQSAYTRNWAFTLNNYAPWDIDHLKEILGFSYLVLGYEVCPTTGTPHIQGFIRFVCRKRFCSVQRILPIGTHIEAARDSHASAVYCKKGGDFEEFGNPPRPRGRAGGEATRSKWEEVRDLARAGDLEEIDAEVYIRYYSTLKRIAKDHMTKPDALAGTCGLWIYGATGTGKTHSVAVAYPDRYLKPLSKWWDGYQDEEIVHLDEPSPTHAAWLSTFLKKWADKWPFDAEVKGGAIQIRPMKFIVTSNYSIEEMGFPEGDLEAIKRRFVEIRKIREQTIIL